MCVWDEATTSQPKGNLDVHTVHKPMEVPGIHQSEYVSHWHKWKDNR